MKRLFVPIVLAICLMSIGTTAAQDSVLKVVATTTIVADVARNVGGDLVNVIALVPPDADAHAFDPTPQDALAVSQADVVLAVGAGYEAFLAGLEQNAGRSDIVVVSNGVTIYPFMESHDHEDEHAEDEHGDEPLGVLGKDDICDEHHDEADHTEDEHTGCDPHVWTDPANAMIWADNIAAAFANADPANADTYAANAETYKEALRAVDEEIRDIVAVVPAERRVLVTNHEFMNYFARAYDFEVVGVVIPGGATGGETDPRALADLIQTVRDLEIPAVFAEASANTRLIETLAGDAGVQVITALSESLTAEGGAASTYLDYLRYNARTIAEALAA